MAREIENSFDANAADSLHVTQWLMTGLDAYINDNTGRWAFRPYEQHIGLHDDLAEDLCALYALLTAPAQSRWRNAIRDLLAMQGRNISKRQAIYVLITFAVRIRSTEALEVLPSILSGSKDPALLNRIVRAAVALADQTEASRKCLDRIRTSPAFTPDYAGLVLVALCHAAPDYWMRHVQELANPMNRLLSDLSPDSPAPRFYARNILEAIGLSRITADALRLLRKEAKQDSQWLLNEWFLGDNSLLKWQKLTASRFRLFVRVNESISTELDRTPVPENLTSAEAQTYQRTAIAWDRSPNATWVALYAPETLRMLTQIEPQIEALISFIHSQVTDFGNDNAEQRQVLNAKQGGVAFLMPFYGPLQVAFDKDLLALWNSRVPNKITERMRYLKPYRSAIPAPFRRLVAENPHAFSAAASAIALTRRDAVTQ